MPTTLTATRYHQSTDGSWKPCSAASDATCPFGSNMPGGLGHIDKDTAERFNKKREELRLFEQEVKDLFGDEGMEKVMRTSVIAPPQMTHPGDPYNTFNYLPLDYADINEKVVTTKAQLRQSVDNQKGERSSHAVRRVLVDMNEQNLMKSFSEDPIEIKGPTDGRPIIVEYRSGGIYRFGSAKGHRMQAMYTDIDVVEGAAIINATNPNGGGVKVRGNAAATIFTPGSKFTIEVSDSAKAVVVPRAGARGRIYVGKDADAVIQNPNGVDHDIEIVRLDRDKR
jgi:hypothetical protein